MSVQKTVEHYCNFLSRHTAVPWGELGGNFTVLDTSRHVYMLADRDPTLLKTSRRAGYWIVDTLYLVV
jgi:hypothetical protein